MSKYTIGEFVELLDNGKLALDDVLKIRDLMNAPFKVHPLGFYSCTLLHENNQKIRLHYWDSITNAEQQSSELMIHDHIFDFKSWIMLGALENIEYEESDEGERYYLYSTKYENDSSILKITDDSLKITYKNSSVYTQGMSYVMGANVLHKTRSVAERTFTILHTQDTGNTSPRVLSNTNMSESEIIFQRKDVNEKELLEKLATLIH
ncbi:hypothetical protein [uncultured Acinetobacter sp.]|uniref:hypothetical protein n=1 Tax=uncultured Acinetobacter sp. TaxID=165433 RepID=UPI002582B972|nr:hypothetical protein [uncultured Acinetobacter sp.]